MTAHNRIPPADLTAILQLGRELVPLISELAQRDGTPVGKAAAALFDRLVARLAALPMTTYHEDGTPTSEARAALIAFLDSKGATPWPTSL